MNKTCVHCSAEFKITDKDLKFYDSVSPIFSGKKYQIPEPTHCPKCRQLRRMAFRNERNLYRRKQSREDKEMISIYSPDKKYNILHPNAWWSDQWNALDYGQEFDFSCGFFEQFSNLLRKTPLLGLCALGCENAEYVNYCGYSRNAYLSYNSDYSENLLYSSDCIQCKDVIDCLKCSHSELCYECVDVHNSYNTSYSQLCENCSNSKFLFDCHSCHDCFGSAGLRNKKHIFLNTQYSKEEYNHKIQELEQFSREKIKKDVQKSWNEIPRICAQIRNSKNVSGDYVSHSKGIERSFDIQQCEDIKYCGTLNTAKNCYDWDYTGYNSELCYELSSCGDRIYNSSFSCNIWSGGKDTFYCFLGSAMKNCFGCVGLRHKKYCILNKQYSKEEYEELVPKIIEHMRETGEWGEFFPVELSPFAYNETVAQEYYPLTKEEVLKKGWKWKEEEEPDFSDVSKKIPAAQLPEKIKDIPDDILSWALECQETKKLYKIQKAELEFYRKQHLPIPHLHPDVRHQKRMSLRNPRKLYSRTCDKCSKSIQTTYSPERPETVYCEECYLKEIYE